jgi:hypothetical protein
MILYIVENSSKGIVLILPGKLVWCPSRYCLSKVFLRAPHAMSGQSYGREVFVLPTTLPG